MSKKETEIKKKSSGFEVVKNSGRRKSTVRVSFSSMMPADYTPQQRDMLKQFESDIIRIREKNNPKK